MLVFSRVCLILTFVVIGTNGTLMLISPRAWFRVPKWIRLSGGLTEARVGRGRTAILIRLLGACYLAVIVFFLHGYFSSWT